MKRRKYLLDTDMFSFVVDGWHQEVRRMVAKKRSEVSISALTLAGRDAPFGLVFPLWKHWSVEGAAHTR